MGYFWDTQETVPSGLGFVHFGSTHLEWLAVFAAVILFLCLCYRRMKDYTRAVLKKSIALSMVIMEGLKILLLVVTGRFYWHYLPLHLCGINIFLILLHAYRPSRILDNFLYLVCIPGALAALLFPNWTPLPIWNIYHIHSFVVHILLVGYPLMQAVNGNFSLDIKTVPKALGMLVILALPIYGLNLLLKTNFMFLMWAEPGNPLYWFGENWGSHLLGVPVIIAGVVFVMYLPVILFKKWKKK